MADIDNLPTVDFKQVRELYAQYAQKGKAAYLKERRFVLHCIRSNHRIGVAKSLYYQHALAGLRQLGI